MIAGKYHNDYCDFKEVCEETKNVTDTRNKRQDRERGSKNTGKRPLIGKYKLMAGTENNSSGDSGKDDLFSASIKAGFDFWQTAIQEMLETKKNGQAEYHPGSFQPFTAGSLQELSQAIQETWFNSGLIDSEDPARGMAKSLDNAVEITQNWIEEANQLFLQGLNGIQQSMSESQQDSQTPPFQAMIEAYSMSMQKMLNMPKLGLNREYQERITQAIDKLNLLTTVACEFSLLLLQPVQHSLIKMQHKLREMPESDGYSEDIKEYYAMWIKMLEGGYMQLLQSPEFVSSFHRVMNAYMEFQAIYEDVMQDALRGMPVAKKNDLEEVYKENHLLKKEVKAMSARIAKLEKKLEELESYKNEKI